jgi:hypothetical protein
MQTILEIIKKANIEGCINGDYVTHAPNPDINGNNVQLSDETIALVSDELIQDFQRNPNIEVCGRIQIKSNTKNK